MLDIGRWVSCNCYNYIYIGLTKYTDFISFLCFDEPLAGESLAFSFTLVWITGWVIRVFGIIRLVTELMTWWVSYWEGELGYDSVVI